MKENEKKIHDKKNDEKKINKNRFLNLCSKDYQFSWRWRIRIKDEKNENALTTWYETSSSEIVID